jgi:hypothetical protein
MKKDRTKKTSNLLSNIPKATIAPHQWTMQRLPRRKLWPEQHRSTHPWPKQMRAAQVFGPSEKQSQQMEAQPEMGLRQLFEELRAVKRN